MKPKTPAVIRIIIVDDHSMVRMGLAGLLAMEPDLNIVAEAEDIGQAVAAFTEHLPDVVLMDVRMPGGSGLEALARIKAISPAARVVMLSTYDLEAPMIEAHHGGACGYLLKSVKFEELVAAIRTVHAGGTCFPPALENYIAARADTGSLTPRELETLEFLRRGFSNKDIAAAMGISENTAKFHVKAILAKLQVVDRAEAVAAAYERGLLQVD
jgi:DNA-binding NarL/FixJ family response regulator